MAEVKKADVLKYLEKATMLEGDEEEVAAQIMDIFKELGVT